MRKLRCKVCGVRWSGIKGSVLKFYEEHEKLHGLVEPTRPLDSYPVESIEDYMARLRAFRRQYFEDSNLP
jgi:hypothetical protein